jgi:hypothetical protein
VRSGVDEKKIKIAGEKDRRGRGREMSVREKAERRSE